VYTVASHCRNLVANSLRAYGVADIWNRVFSAMVEFVTFSKRSFK
jgi:hypothetical protein